MNRLPTKAEIDECLEPSPWDLGNSVLYQFCRHHFEHKRLDEIIAKTWLIGRSYAAAVERRKNNRVISDDFYVDIVAPTIRKSRIDFYLANLKQYSEITSSNVVEILRLHHYLVITLEPITGLEKRAFCSKYLHFHLPALFFIYDSRASTAMRTFVSRVPKDLAHIVGSTEIDTDYAKFVSKCLALRNLIAEEYECDLTTRQLDNLLLNVANRKRA
jgi:hypothetical protein